MRIIDAHHHFWDPIKNYHPWLCDKPMIPFRYGAYESLCTPFMPEQYDAVSARWDIVASVTMEGEWDPNDPCGEAVWLQELHENTGRPAAHAAQIQLDHKSRDEVLERYSELSVVRSLRHKPRVHSQPGEGQSSMCNPDYVEGYHMLADTGFAFELQVPWWHLDDVPLMRGGVSTTPIILNHAGLPADRSADGIEAWRGAVTRFAKLDNVKVKISGLGSAKKLWDSDSNRDIIRMIIDIFGTDRCMFASNFPVDGLCASFDTIFDCFDASTRDLSESDRENLFFKTAATTYRIAL